MQILFKNRYIVDFVATVIFFTRIPVNWAYFSDKAPNLTRAAWAFPLIGYFIGFCSGIIGDLSLFFGMSTLTNVGMTGLRFGSSNFFLGDKERRLWVAARIALF